MQLQDELNSTLLRSLQLKARIIGILLACIAGVQILVIIYLLLASDIFQSYLPLQKAIFGPLLILLVSYFEFYAARHFNSAAANKRPWSRRLSFCLSFCEISFPTLLLVFAASFIENQSYFTPNFLLNSPPGLIYFVLIILSAFTLDHRLCLFTGIAAGVEYIAFSLVFMSIHNAGFNEAPNHIVKGILMIVCGIVTGVVSKQIRQAVESSLRAKNDLIHRLDGLVSEKTAEIERQKQKLVEKNREITDSIHYASRIQRALMPTGKYIMRQVERLRS